MRGTLAVCLAALIMLGAPLWCLAASITLGFQTDWPMPIASVADLFLLWLRVWWLWGSDPGWHFWLVRSALVALAAVVPPVLGLTAWTVLRRKIRLRALRTGESPLPPQQAASSVHGTAAWMTERERDDRYRTPNLPAWVGVPIGEAYDPTKGPVARLRFNPKNPKTWGQGGKAPLLIDDCTGEPHGVIINPSGGGKTAASTIAAHNVFTGATVTFDPSGQVAPIVAAYRRSLGHDVYTVGPGKHGFNLLSWIDPAHPLAEQHVLTALDWVCGEIGEKAKGDNGLFVEGGREMEAAILADMLWDTDLPREKRNLREFRRRITTPEGKIKGFLAEIAERSRSQMARDYASQLCGTYAKTFSGMYRHAASETKWLSTSALADMVCRDDFRPEQLTYGNLDLFVQIGKDTLKSSPGVARAVIGGILHAVYRAEGRVSGQILALLDEARFLGRLEVMADIRDDGRKYRMTMITMWPSLASLTDVWKAEGRELFLACSAWQMFAAINDDVSAEYVSKMCDQRGVLSYSEGTSSNRSGGGPNGGRSSGKTWSVSEQPCKLISPAEVRKLRGDAAIILPRSGPPLLCGRPFYFRRAEMKARMQADPFMVAQQPQLVAAE